MSAFFYDIICLEGDYMNPWKSEEYLHKYKNTENQGGITLSFDSVPKELKEVINDFTKWLAENYFFPIRINVIITKDDKLALPSGKRVYSQFKHYESHSDCEIILPIGRYKKRWTNKDILGFYIYELTHYMQWINQYDLMQTQKDKEAKYYKNIILNHYLYDKKTLLFDSYTHRQYKHDWFQRTLLYMFTILVIVFTFASIGFLFIEPATIPFVFFVFLFITPVTILLIDISIYKVHIGTHIITITRLLKNQTKIEMKDIRRELKLIPSKSRYRDEYHLELYNKSGDTFKIKVVDKELIQYLRLRGFRIPHAEKILNKNT